MINFLYITLLLLVFGCQGMPSKKTPIHLNPNMDNQERYDAQEKQYFSRETWPNFRNIDSGPFAVFSGIS